MSTKHADNRSNQTDFANKLKVSRQAVNKAIKAGLIILHGQGRAAYIDMACPMTKAYIRNASSNRHRGKGTKARTNPVPASSEKKAPDYVPPSPEALESVEAFEDKQMVARRKLLEQIEKMELENRETRKELIARKLLQSFMHELYSIHSGQLQTHGLRASSDMAAIFGIEDDALIRKACDKIDKDMASILKQIKKGMNKYLKKIGAEKITDSQAA